MASGSSAFVVHHYNIPLPPFPTPHPPPPNEALHALKRKRVTTDQNASGWVGLLEWGDWLKKKKRYECVYSHGHSNFLAGGDPMVCEQCCRQKNDTHPPTFEQTKSNTAGRFVNTPNKAEATNILIVCVPSACHMLSDVFFNPGLQPSFQFFPQFLEYFFSVYRFPSVLKVTFNYVMRYMF